jgi:hypothetical protein
LLLSDSITQHCLHRLRSRSRKWQWTCGWTPQARIKHEKIGWALLVRNSTFFWGIPGPKEQELFCRCSKTPEWGAAPWSAYKEEYEASVLEVELHRRRELSLHSSFLWTIITAIDRSQQTLPYPTPSIINSHQKSSFPK